MDESANGSALANEVEVSTQRASNEGGAIMEQTNVLRTDDELR